MFALIAIATGIVFSSVVALAVCMSIIGYLRLMREDLKADLVDMEARLHGSIGKIDMKRKAV